MTLRREYRAFTPSPAELPTRRRRVLDVGCGIHKQPGSHRRRPQSCQPRRCHRRPRPLPVSVRRRRFRPPHAIHVIEHVATSCAPWRSSTAWCEPAARCASKRRTIPISARSAIPPTKATSTASASAISARITAASAITPRCDFVRFRCASSYWLCGGGSGSNFWSTVSALPALLGVLPVLRGARQGDGIRIRSDRVIGWFYRAADLLRRRAMARDHGRLGEDLALPLSAPARVHGGRAQLQGPLGRGRNRPRGVGWREKLVFVEVKTRVERRLRRTRRAVDEEKQRRIAIAAREYGPRASVAAARTRFDIVSVILGRLHASSGCATPFSVRVI
jgi:hypothetical protein